MNRNRVTFYNILSTILLQGLAFLSGPIFSNLLGTNNYGIAAVYLTWVQVGSTVFSLQAAGTIALARVRFPLEEQEKFQSSVLSLASLSYIIFSGLTLVVCTVINVFTEISILILDLRRCSYA